MLIINKLYNEILSQYDFFKKVLRSNNRLNYLYQKTRQNIKSLKRLRNEFDYLLQDIDGMLKIENDNVINSETYLRIA